MPLPLAGRIALVTGASRGIGYQAALALARAGAHVVALARTVGGLEELDDAVKAMSGSATLVPLDLKDYAGIDRLALALHERFGRLDIMVGNAAILGPLSPLAHVEATAWDEVMAVNVTANWRLLRAMDRLLQSSGAGRVVFISSGVAARARAYWGPYAISKAALDVLARTYAAEIGHHECPRQRAHAGTDAHPHASAGDAGRGSDDARDTGQGRRNDRGIVPSEHAGERQALFLSGTPVPGISPAVLTVHGRPPRKADG